MSNMVTRCPQCHTSFRVTEEHLKLANGAVRCGSCLLVFQARQHWVNPENHSVPSAASVSSQPKSAPPGKFQFDQSAIDSHAEHASAPAHDNGMPSQPFDLRAAAGLGATPTTTSAPSATGKKLDDIHDDEKISDDFGLEDDEPVVVPSKSTEPLTSFGEPDDDYSSVFDDFEGDAASKNTQALDNFNDIDALLDSTDAALPEADRVTDESWAQEMLSEIEEEDKPKHVNLSEIDDVRDAFVNPVDTDAARRDLGISGRTDPFAAQDLGNTQHGDGRAKLIAHIEPLPVDLLSTRAGQRKAEVKSLLIWSAAALGLAVLLLAQYIFFNFDRLAKTSTSRPYIQTICHLVGCQLPAVENWRYIRIQNLVVRKNPQVANALIIDAILLNITEQPLAFPDLDLYFSDLAKTPVASRRFKPSEYLSGEMSGQTMIPPGNPVHIALDIQNPGEEAVNWSMQVAGKVEQ